MVSGSKPCRLHQARQTSAIHGRSGQGNFDLDAPSGLISGLVKEYGDQQPRAPVEDAGEKKVVALWPVHVVPIDEEVKPLADFNRKSRGLDALHLPLTSQRRQTKDASPGEQACTP